MLELYKVELLNGLKLIHQVNYNTMNEKECREKHKEINETLGKDRERIVAVEVNIQQMIKSVDGVKNSVDKFIEKSDKNYAPMWVANAMKYLMATTAGVIIIAVLGSVIR